MRSQQTNRSCLLARARLLVPFLCLVLAACVTAYTAPPPSGGSASSGSPSDLERKILELVNRERTERGAALLDFHPDAQRAAERWTPRMIEAGETSHQNLSDLLGGDVVGVGENTAVNSVMEAEALVQQLMESPGHRENILEPGFTHIGIAAGRGPFRGLDALWVTQVFLRVERE